MGFAAHSDQFMTGEISFINLRALFTLEGIGGVFVQPLEVITPVHQYEGI